MSLQNNKSISSLQLSEILVILKPFIHLLVILSRILQWKPINDNNSDNDNDNNYKTNPTLLIVLLWTILCFHYKFLLGIVLPTIIMTGLLPKMISMTTTAISKTTPPSKVRFGARRSSCSTNQNLEDDDPIMTEIIHELAELAKLYTLWFHESTDDHYDHNLIVKKKKLTTIKVRDCKTLIMASCLILFWQWILHTSRLCHLVWATGCLFLTWWSPWVQMLRHMIQQRKMSLIGTATQETTNTGTKTTALTMTTTSNADDNNNFTSPKQELDRLYCFSVYEHQRWWFHGGWSKLLLPHDRPNWSDEYLEPTPSIDAFNLPPSSHSSHWIWADPSWLTDKSGVKDDNGWEYGNWDWNGWSNKSTGLTVLTRRRRWIRCARRIEESSNNDSVNDNNEDDAAESITSYSSSADMVATTAASAAESIQAALLSSSPKSTTTTSSGCSSPSLLFSPKPRPTSLLTHRTLSSITTISSSTSTSSSLTTSYGSPTFSSSSSPITTTAKDCGTHFWLHR